MNRRLGIAENQRYLVEIDKEGNQYPFFWVGDTAWMLLEKLTLNEIEEYFSFRKQQGFNVIQCVIANAADAQHGAKLPLVWDETMRTISNRDFNQIEENSIFWNKIEQMLKLAEKYELYIALLPVWGSMVKDHILTSENVSNYAAFLSKRYGQHKNIIWTLGGDIRGDVGFDTWNIFGRLLKQFCPEQLVTFHPFGRTSSAMWFNEEKWLDLNMFQSGHRRYDQGNLGLWDDNHVSEEFFGEDNWRYVKRELNREQIKPVLDAEPSYEGLPQGLHDVNQPYWKAADVRRYAYWSVFQGACGHTYGHNAVMQFYRGVGDRCNYGPKITWEKALQEPGARQMTMLADLMRRVNFQSGSYHEELLSQEQGKQYQRICPFQGDTFIYVYDYLGIPFQLKMDQLPSEIRTMLWFDPENGMYSECSSASIEQIYSVDRSCQVMKYTPPRKQTDSTDWVLILSTEEWKGDNLYE